jgi:hypothetical protein
MTLTWEGEPDPPHAGSTKASVIVADDNYRETPLPEGLRVVLSTTRDFACSQWQEVDPIEAARRRQRGVE